jgi:hypothetical protein
MAVKFSDRHLLMWADCLEDYAENWDDHFKKHGKFFTQEYWYLLVGIMRAYWVGEPLNVAGAKDSIRGLQGYDDRAKDARISAAIDAGLIYKSDYKELSPELQTSLGEIDRRYKFLLPTAALENAMRSHLAATLAMAIDALGDIPR